MVTTISDLPTTPSRADSPTTFNARMIAWVAALASRTTQANTQSAEMDASATSAATAVQDALDGATPVIWVTGTSYTIGQKRYSPIDLKTYRRKTNGAGSTDPSADSTNWAVCVGTGNVKSAAVQTIENKTIVDAVLEGTPTHDIYDIDDDASVEIDPANGDWQTWTLGANRTPTAAGTWANGESVELWVSDGTAYAVTWTSIVTSWMDSQTPVLPTSGSAKIMLTKIGGLIYGAWLGNIA
jgi:hypothetical protein